MVQYGWDGTGMGYLVGGLLFLFLFGVYSMCLVARVLLYINSSWFWIVLSRLVLGYCNHHHIPCDCVYCLDLSITFTMPS